MKGRRVRACSQVQKLHRGRSWEGLLHGTNTDAAERGQRGTKATSSHSTARAFRLDAGQRSTDSPTVSPKIGDTGPYTRGPCTRARAGAPSLCTKMHETASRAHLVEVYELQGGGCVWLPGTHAPNTPDAPHVSNKTVARPRVVFLLGTSSQNVSVLIHTRPHLLWYVTPSPSPLTSKEFWGPLPSRIPPTQPRSRLQATEPPGRHAHRGSPWLT